MRKLAARNVLMPFVTHNFLEDMALVLCVAALATVIRQLLRQPLVVGDLIAGMVVGPHVPGVHANLERVRLVSDLGVTALVFAIGLEFNLRRLVRLARTAGLAALIQAAWMIWLGYLVERLMGWTPWESLVAGASCRYAAPSSWPGCANWSSAWCCAFCPAGKYLRRSESISAQPAT
jgi:Kef-type K+ transport system membrane component KefB